MQMSIGTEDLAFLDHAVGLGDPALGDRAAARLLAERRVET